MFARMVTGFGIALGIGLMAPPSEAAITWNLKPSGTGNWDWTLSGLNLRYDQTDAQSTLPYSLFYGFMWTNSADHCIEVATGPGLFVPNPDTRIWVKNGSASSWQSVNDDFNGTLQSKARLWVSFPSPHGGEYYAKVAPYSSSSSGQDFGLSVTRRDLSEAACTTDQTTIPWVKIVGNGTLLTTLVFSPNAH